jgi:transposase
MAPGRRTRLNDEVIAVFEAGLKKGVYFRACCALAGVFERTALQWRQKGRAQLEKGDDGVYGRFEHACKRANALCTDVDMDAISAAAQDGDWHAAAWRQERKHPEHYGKRQYVEHKNVSEAVDVSFDVTSPEPEPQEK